MFQRQLMLNCFKTFQALSVKGNKMYLWNTKKSSAVLKIVYLILPDCEVHATCLNM